MREVGADSKQPRHNEPRVNLLPAPGSLRGSRNATVSRGVLVMAAIAVVSWAVAGVGIALLLGWRPGIGVGP